MFADDTFPFVLLRYEYNETSWTR